MFWWICSYIFLDDFVFFKGSDSLCLHVNDGEIVTPGTRLVHRQFLILRIAAVNNLFGLLGDHFYYVTNVSDNATGMLFLCNWLEMLC